MAEQNVRNDLSVVKYEVLGGIVEFTVDDVRTLMVKGGGNLTNQEVVAFMQLCKFQKLNPWTGEAYAIKFGSDFQLVVGYETYKRRAEENPTYVGRKSGIVVLRGEQVIQKEGTCLYPNEQLLGGWCRVYRGKHGKDEETYKEVGLKEYDKGQANWKTKPCTMIEKVAVSQALRAAFPKDFEGLYTAEEVAPADYVDADYKEVKDEPITQEQRQKMFKNAHDAFGKQSGNAVIAEIIGNHGLTSTTGMITSIYEQAMQELDEKIADAKSNESEGGADDDGSTNEENTTPNGETESAQKESK